MTSPIPENGCIFMGGWDILDLDRPKGCPLDKTSPFKPVPGDVTLRRKAKGKVFSPRKEEQTAEKHLRMLSHNPSRSWLGQRSGQRDRVR